MLFYVEKDVVTSGDDLKTLITKQRTLKLFNAILQSESNFYQNPKHKSSTSVNAKLPDYSANLPISVKRTI